MDMVEDFEEDGDDIEYQTDKSKLYFLQYLDYLRKETYEEIRFSFPEELTPCIEKYGTGRLVVTHLGVEKINNIIRSRDDKITTLNASWYYLKTRKNLNAMIKLLNDNPSINHVILHYTDIDNDVLHDLIVHVCTIKHIVTFDVSCNEIHHRGFDELLTFLGTTKGAHIKTLGLDRNTGLYYDIGKESIARFFRSSACKIEHLINLQLSDITSILEYNTSINTVCLWKYDVSIPIWNHLNANPHNGIKTINLRGSKFLNIMNIEYDSHYDGFFKFITGNTKLEKIILNDASICNQYMIQLLHSLIGCSSISEIDISKNNINRDSFLALMVLLRVNRSIKRVYITILYENDLSHLAMLNDLFEVRSFEHFQINLKVSMSPYEHTCINNILITDVIDIIINIIKTMGIEYNQWFHFNIKNEHPDIQPCYNDCITAQNKIYDQMLLNTCRPFTSEKNVYKMFKIMKKAYPPFRQTCDNIKTKTIKDYMMDVTKNDMIIC